MHGAWHPNTRNPRSDLLYYNLTAPMRVPSIRHLGISLGELSGLSPGDHYCAQAHYKYKNEINKFLGTKDFTRGGI